VLTFDPRKGSFLALVERDPRLLIEIPADLRVLRSLRHLGADSGIETEGEDISGITWDQHRDTLWIASDTGRRVFLYDPRTGLATGRKLKRKGKPLKV
jgi:uncharacterized protein YjiK